ncbi:unnamed protein product [Thelazia callipaeda]|uniref:tRNA-intron lyase n=1 Tax=Thelazia callipaeda TaxID=103827 RepID=A0A0N5CZP1_THECL|nr:unnamed protein product [Thelazia callipaeda]
MSPKDGSLRLSMEESFYLCAEVNLLRILNDEEVEYAAEDIWQIFFNYSGIQFVRRYATYRFLRNCGWAVRSGLHYGVDFMIYRDGAKYHHSSAGVRIVIPDKIRSVIPFIALNRELNSVKKRLIEATVTIPSNCNLQSMTCIRMITISTNTCLTWNTSDGR